MDCFIFWGDSKHLKILFKSADTITSLSSAGGLVSRFCIFHRPCISRQQHSWRLNEKKLSTLSFVIPPENMPHRLVWELPYSSEETPRTYIHTHCYDTNTNTKTCIASIPLSGLFPQMRSLFPCRKVVWWWVRRWGRIFSFLVKFGV